MSRLAVICGVVLCSFLMAAVGPAVAQQPAKPQPAKPQSTQGLPAKPAASAEPKSLGTFDAWIAIEVPEAGGKVCYTLSRPEKSEPAGLKRGDALLTVSHRPAANRRDEASFQSGYPYKPDVPVAVEVDGKKFAFFTKPAVQAELAWANDGAVDKALVEAMRSGRRLLVKGTSARNTATTDTISLAGFTKAYSEISKACPAK
ncbi:MAG: hypothetical protein HY246_23635 [Proteobacteria bacterium]|nr:hypothetical protein [Pseudomonadota bacterium]